MFKPLVFQNIEVAKRVALELSMTIENAVYVIFDNSSNMHFVDLNASITIPSEMLLGTFVRGEEISEKSTKLIKNSTI